MYKKTLTYTDYNGESRTEDFYFNLNKAEIIDMQLSINGGFDGYIKKITAEKDTAKLIKLFKDLILRSYGEKSLDGKRFVKDMEKTVEFTQTEAFSELYVTLATDTNEAVAFIKGIFPANPDFDKEVDRIVKEETAKIGANNA